MKINSGYLLRNFYSLVFTIVAWIIPLALLVFMNRETPGSDISLAFKTGKFIELLLVSVIMFGVVHWLLNRMTDIPNIRKMSMGFIIAIRFLGFFLTLVLYEILDVMTIFDERFGFLPDKISIEFFTSGYFLSLWLYILFVDTIYSSFYQIRTLIGKHIFRNLLLGKYRTPRTEKRIFMFIDMKDSTTHAERLGHLKFTRLIQKCFRDFGMIAMKRRVNIYQYVGDEVIVSWLIRPGLNNQNCLRLFFEFREKLLENSGNYQREFGLKPIFKAGVHMGDVTVAEIGVAKRGIEYLSDVLNTTARIQGMCNQYDTDILISRKLHDELDESPDIDMKHVESMILKGKTQKVDLYRVTHDIK
jgi:adenylate cyclase